MLCTFHARQKQGEPCVQLSVNCKIGDGRAVRSTVAVVMHSPEPVPSISQSFGGWQIGPRQRSSSSRNVKATSGRPVAPPPPAAAQAAAPNRQQNAGTKTPDPIRFNQNSTDLGCKAEPNLSPDKFSLLQVHCHCCSSKQEQTSVLPLFHLVPGRCGSRGRLTPVLGPLPPPEGFPPAPPGAIPPN